MAELIKKAYFKNKSGIVQSAKLYTTLDEVQGQGVPVVIGGIQGYMKYGETTDSNATSARIKRYDNLIPVAKRKFEGWFTYGKSIVTLSHGIAMPEWRTTEATRIQTSGGSSDTKLYTSNIIPPIGTKCALRCLVKNQGTKPMVIATNLGTYVTVNIGEAKAVFSNAVGNGSGAFQFLCKTTNIGDSMDIIAYKPEMYYSDELNKDWAILSQAQVPYGSQTYAANGTFTVPDGITKVKVTVKGAGGGGGGSLWVIDDSDERKYFINSGGNGGRGGLSVQTLTVTPGVQYPVTVGSGGSGGSNDRNSPAGSGAGGGTSSFLTVSATGGGGGGGGSYESSGSSGTNGSPAGAGANGGSGSSGVGNGNGGIGANGSVLIEWGGDIS